MHRPNGKAAPRTELVFPMPLVGAASPFGPNSTARPKRDRQRKLDRSRHRQMDWRYRHRSNRARHLHDQRHPSAQRRLNDPIARLDHVLDATNPAAPHKEASLPQPSAVADPSRYWDAPGASDPETDCQASDVIKPPLLRNPVASPASVAARASQRWRRQCRNARQAGTPPLQVGAGVRPQADRPSDAPNRRPRLSSQR